MSVLTMVTNVQVPNVLVTKRWSQTSRSQKSGSQTSGSQTSWSQTSAHRVGRGKHLIFNSKTDIFWERRRVVEIVNDYQSLTYLTLLMIFSRLGGGAGWNLSEYI